MLGRAQSEMASSLAHASFAKAEVERLNAKVGAADGFSSLSSAWAWGSAPPNRGTAGRADEEEEKEEEKENDEEEEEEGCGAGSGVTFSSGSAKGEAPLTGRMMGLGEA